MKRCGDKGPRLYGLLMGIETQNIFMAQHCREEEEITFLVYVMRGGSGMIQLKG
jgi:hypothetical protein